MRKTITAVAAAALLLMAGCADSEQPSTSDSGNRPTTGAAQPATHNDADIAFAQQMVVHHQQAVDMAELASSRGSNDKVKDLANRIKQAQDPEIQQMNGWLTQWGATMPSMPGMDHGSGPGMMTDDEMRQLEQASGAEFDRMFLEMMIRHHQGAIEQAGTEVEKGANPDAKELAQRIIDAQQAEITEMEALVKTF